MCIYKVRSKVNKALDVWSASHCLKFRFFFLSLWDGAVKSIFTWWFINRTSALQRLASVQRELHSIQRGWTPLGLPCSLGLETFPQGLVAVTVAAQVASMSARFSTPVLFFLPVARSHSPQAWKSYLHSPTAAHKEKKKQTKKSDT